MASIDHYTVLDLKPDAAPDEIKKAYRAMAVKTHPDRGGATHLFRMVQEAYETLSDPDKRAAYDREIGGYRPEPRTYYEPGQDAEAEAAEETEEVTGRSRKILLVATIAVLTVLAGLWLFQEYQLWTLVQAKNQFRMYTAQGVPAIAYAALWLWGTLVAAFAEDVLHAAMLAVGSSATAGAFAFITATGTPEQWIPALITGLVLTLAIAITVRVAANR